MNMLLLLMFFLTLKTVESAKCQWKISEFTPGAIGSQSLNTPRRHLEFVEIARPYDLCDDEEMKASEASVGTLFLLVVESIHYVGTNAEQSQPVVIAHMNLARQSLLSESDRQRLIDDPKLVFEKQPKQVQNEKRAVGRPKKTVKSGDVLTVLSGSDALKSRYFVIGNNTCAETQLSETERQELRMIDLRLQYPPKKEAKSTATRTRSTSTIQKEAYEQVSFGVDTSNVPKSVISLLLLDVPRNAHEQFDGMKAEHYLKHFSYITDNGKYMTTKSRIRLGGKDINFINRYLLDAVVFSKKTWVKEKPSEEDVMGTVHIGAQFGKLFKGWEPVVVFYNNSVAGTVQRCPIYQQLDSKLPSTSYEWKQNPHTMGRDNNCDGNHLWVHKYQRTLSDSEAVSLATARATRILDIDNEIEGQVTKRRLVEQEKCTETVKKAKLEIENNIASLREKSVVSPDYQVPDADPAFLQCSNDGDVCSNEPEKGGRLPSIHVSAITNLWGLEEEQDKMYFRYLDDSVIELFILSSIRVHKKDSTHAVVPPCLSSSVVSSTSSTPTFPSYAGFSVILVPICKHHHWIMAVLYLETNKIKLFNSLSNVIPETRKQELLRIAEKVTGRSQNLWTVEPFTNPPVQKDAHNCGVYVCRAADQIVQNLELDFNKFDAEDFREEIYNRLHTFHTSHLLLLADAESWPDWGSEPVKKNYYLDDAPEMVTDDYKTQRDIDNYVEEKVEERLEGTNFGQLETSATIERKPDYANDPPADLLQNHNLESQLQSGSVTKVILERLVALEQTLSSVQSALAPIAENLQAKAIKDPSLLELNRKLQGATEDALHGQQRINDLRLSLNRLKSVKGFSSLPVDTIVKQYGEWLVFEFNSASPVDSRFRCRHCTGHNQQKPATTSASATTAKTNTSKRSVAFRIRQLRHKRQTESSKDKAQRLAVQEALSKEQQRARQLKTERLAGKVTKTKANRLASAEGLTMREVLKGSKTLDTNSKKRLMNLLNTHPSSPRHSSSYELQKIETFEAIRRNALTTNKIAATNSMMRTAFLIVKKNYAYSGMPDLVMTQIINGARMGIHHYSGKACVEMGLAISDKLHLNLLTVIHSKTAPVSILMDSSTDRQGRQYLIVSVRTVVSHYPKTFFFHLLELNQETGKSLLTDILKMLAEDEDMLVRYNSNLDGFSSHFKNQLVALSTDGASVVAGTFQGFRGLLTSYLDTHQYDRNLYFTHCRAHKLDLALKAVNFPFRHFLQTLYSSVYNVFGTSRMHKNINFLKDSARTLGLRSYAIKTVFPVRWSESELQAVQNLIRMWHPITVTLNFFLETKEARKPKNKKLYQTLASLRYVMTDAKVFLQVHHWQGLLERLTLASKSYQAKDSLITEAHSTLLSLTADLKKPATGSTFADHDKALDDRYGLQCQLSSGWKACSTTELNKFGKPDFTSITSIGLNSTIRTHGKFRKEIGTRFLDGVFRDISVDRNSEIGKELLEQVEMLHFSGTTTLEEENKFSTLATRFKIEIPTTEGERGTTSLLQRAIKYARESEEVVLDDAFSLEAFDVLPPVIQTYLAMQEKDLMYSKFKTDANAAISDELKKRFLDNTVGNVVDSSNPHLFVAMEYNLLMDVLRYGYAKVFKEATYSASEIKRYSRSWFGKGDGVDLKLRGDKTITTTAELATKLSVPAATAVDYIDFLTNLRQNVQSYLQNNPTSPRAEKLSIANLEKNSPQYLWKQLLDLSDKIPDMMTENVKAMILNMLSVPTGTAEIERMFSMLFFSKAERRSKLSRQNLEATLRVRSNTDNNIVNFDATPFSWFWYNNPLQSTCRMLSDDPLDMNRSRMYKFKQYLADVKHNVFEPMKASDFNIDQFDMDREDSLLDTAEDELGGDTLQFLSLTDPAFAESNEVDSINRNIYKQLQG